MSSSLSGSSTVYTRGNAVSSKKLGENHSVNMDFISSTYLLAHSLHRSFYTSSDTFTLVQNGVALLLVALDTLKEHSSVFHSDSSYHSELCVVMQDCFQTLSDLQQLKRHSHGVDAEDQVIDPRGKESGGLADIRARLSSCTGVLNSINTNILRPSQATIEHTLGTFLEQVKTDKAEESAISTASFSTNGEQLLWKLRKALESAGIDRAVFAQNREFIIMVFKKAMSGKEGPLGDIDLDDPSAFPSADVEAANPDTSPVKQAPQEVASLPRETTDEKHQAPLAPWKTLLASEVVSTCTRKIVDSFFDIFYSAALGDLDSVARRLEKGANVNATDSSGDTVLHKAAARGHKDLVQFLLERAAKLNTPNTSGDTASHKAAANGHREVVQFLLDRGAEIDASNTSGDTALHLAAASGHEEVVRVLLANGMDVNKVNNHEDANTTALHKAAENGHDKVTLELLKNGADVSVKDFWNETALHKAGEKEHAKVVQILLKSGAEIDFKASIRSRGKAFWVISDWKHAGL